VTARWRGYGIVCACLSAHLNAAAGRSRLEFAAFSVKSMAMTARFQDHDRFLRGGRPTLAILSVLGCLLTSSVPHPAVAQMFSDRPPPVPPGLVPDPSNGSAISLAPPSGPGSGPQNLPGPLTQPPIANVAPPLPVQPPAGASTSGQGVLALTARYGKDLPVIGNGLIWRVFADRPDETGAFKLIREERGATPNIVLPPGNYVVHVSLGLVSAVRPVTLKADTDRESFVLPAGGLRIEGRVGTSKIPQNQISFSIYKGSQFEVGERAPLVPSVAAGDVVLLPEGTYYIISNYGDANSVVRSDIRVQASKLTDVIITHRAAVITLKLVSDKGGEALANTAWSVITPGGDVIKESIGAFPRVVLSEGEYRAIAKNEGKVFERPFNVVNGVDGEIEVVAH
jgi:hypothetical protein